MWRNNKGQDDLHRAYLKSNDIPMLKLLNKEQLNADERMLNDRWLDIQSTFDTHLSGGLLVKKNSKAQN